MATVISVQSMVTHIKMRCSPAASRAVSKRSEKIENIYTSLSNSLDPALDFPKILKVSEKIHNLLFNDQLNSNGISYL